MAVLKMILWGINQIKLSEIMWQRIRTVPKYWTLTFVARIYSWDVSKSSAHSGNAQTFPFLSALLMYDITNLSFFLVSTIPRYHFVSFPSAQNAITCSHCTISLYFWHIAPILLLNISLMLVGTASDLPIIPCVTLHESLMVIYLEHLALLKYEIRFCEYSSFERLWWFLFNRKTAAVGIMDMQVIRAYLTSL